MLGGEATIRNDVGVGESGETRRRIRGLATNTEVLIVGAGVTGICTALELVREGREVLVVERNEVGAGASGNNAGSCAIQNKMLSLVPLAREAVRIWQAWQDELGQENLDLGYVRSGGLRLAETEEEVAELHRSGTAQRALGVPVTFLCDNEARQVASYLGPSVVAANWCPEDGFCDVLHAMSALSTALRRRGGNIWTHTTATSITPHGRGFLIETTRGPVQADRVIIATGIWARDLTHMLGMPIPLQARINILSVTRRAPPMMSHMITHASHRLTMKQLHVGSVLIGGGWQGTGDYSTNRTMPTFESLIGNWKMAVRTVPALRHLEILRSWASADGRSPDDMPLIGPIPGLPGAYIAVCCPGGWTIGPFIARAMARMVRDDHVHELLTPFAPQRFCQP